MKDRFELEDGYWIKTVGKKNYQLFHNGDLVGVTHKDNFTLLKNVPDKIMKQFYIFSYPKSISKSEKNTVFYLMFCYTLNYHQIQNQDIDHCISNLVSEYAKGDILVLNQMREKMLEESFKEAVTTIIDSMGLDNSKQDSLSLIWFIAEKFMDITSNYERRRLWQDLYQTVDNNEDYHEINNFDYSKLNLLEQAFIQIDKEMEKV